ncbi:DUF3310 domain-containing protein [Methylobacter sp. Wu8]|uniref:DUF3310 domain-containing protein n=1 Tax=Methylobacter sp. Wu8 TaxID=3118457 RepID=UPI002F2FA0D9
MITNPLNIQIGGDHYKNMTIQPVEYIHQNNLSFLAGCIIKRICRFNKPGGKGNQDLQKIKHELDLLIDQYNKGYLGAGSLTQCLPLVIDPLTFFEANQLGDEQRTMITLITAYHHSYDITALYEARILIIDIISAFNRSNWIADAAAKVVQS